MTVRMSELKTARHGGYNRPSLPTQRICRTLCPARRLESRSKFQEQFARRMVMPHDLRASPEGVTNRASIEYTAIFWDLDNQRPPSGNLSKTIADLQVDHLQHLGRSSAYALNNFCELFSLPLGLPVALTKLYSEITLPWCQG